MYAFQVAMQGGIRKCPHLWFFQSCNDIAPAEFQEHPVRL